MAQLPILFRIQEIESRLQVLRRTKDQIQANPNLLSLLSLKKDLNHSITKLETERKTNLSIQRQLELDLQTTLDHLKHEEEKLYNGSVATSRGLEQVQQKVAEYHNAKSKLEDQILVLLEQDEKISNELTGFQKRLALSSQEIEKFQQEISEKLMEVIMEESVLQPELAELTPQIPPDWLERYRKIAKSRFGVGIARVKVDSCGGCHVGLSDALLQKVKRGEDALYYCENCGRILYY